MKAFDSVLFIKGALFALTYFVFKGAILLRWFMKIVSTDS